MAGSSSSWGGSVVALASPSNASETQYWMTAALMAGHCGLNSWESNSEIVLAQSVGGPEGPFQPVQTIMSYFAHNPTLHRIPTSSLDGTGGGLIVVHIGQGTEEHPYIGNCSNGSTPATASERESAAQQQRDARELQGIGLPNVLFRPANADGSVSPNGTWEVYPGSNAWSFNNPALYFYPNGSVLMVYKFNCACPPPCTFCRQFGLATAPSWKGPYTDLGLIPVYGEDAYIWRDPAGAPGGGWHMLFQGGSYAPMYPQYVGHWHTAYSADGLNWTVAAWAEAFTNNITTTSGETITFPRRERTQVLFDGVTGAPAYMYNGVTTGAADASFTAVQPIARS